MRSKEKVNINGQLPPEVFSKLKQISECKNLSLIKTIEFLIQGYKNQDCKDQSFKGIIVVPKKLLKEKSTPKLNTIEPTKAELWKAHNSKK